MGSWLNGTVIDNHGYTRDRENNITQVTDNGLNSTYGYDDLYRLVSSNVQGVASTWSYDAVGNRSSQTVGGVTTSYTYNSANRLTAVNGVTVSSDANGNVTAYNGDSYTWDVRGRLSGLSRTGLTASFGYRQDGARTSKTVNGATTSYLLDGDSILKETTAGVATDVLQGPGVDAVLKRGSRWLTPDGLGSTATLTDSAGAVQQRYYYQPFGQGMPQPAPGDPQPFQFAGRENDGTGLYYCRARYYVPDWGRFLSEDPLGFAAGINQYAYCGNNPVNAIDPTGFDEVPGWVRGLANGTSTVLGILGGFGGFVIGGGSAALTGPGVFITAPGLSVVGAATGSAGGIWAGQKVVVGLYHFFSSAGGGSGGGSSPDPGDILMPGGSPVGSPGGKPTIRELPGGQPAAQDLFDQLAQRGTDVTPAKYPGKMVELPGGDWVGLRPVSKSGPPTIDTNIKGIPITKIKFP
jgi:RHS repeat-associated protein